MRAHRSLPIGTLFMVLVIALASLGVGYGLWSRTLLIRGVVNTGNVSSVFRGAFTDDDGKVDNPALDSGDTGNCPVQAGGQSSCDPAASGADPKPRHDKDVALCVAEVGPAGETARVTKRSAYPGYFCTAWFGIHNNGSIPVKVASLKVNGKVVRPSIPTPFDLSGDGKADVTIHLTGVQLCQQIDPSRTVLMDIDQQILQDAPQGATLSYTVEVQLNQWNEDCLEVDHFPNSRALIGIQTPDGKVFSAVLHGPTTVEVALASLSDSDNDGLEQVPTEIVALELTGVNPDLGPVIVRLRDPAKPPFRRTVGEIEETANTQSGRLDLPPFAPSGTARSFFDVFFEVELPALGIKLHNNEPSRLEATITHKPPGPGNTYIKPEGAIPLFDENNNPTGINLVGAVHVPNPRPDLTVKITDQPTRVACQPEVGCTATVEFTVANVGADDVAADFTVLIEADEVPSKTITVSGGLAAGESRAFTETLGPGGNCYNPDCTVKVTVDSGAAITESDETNNSDSRTDLG